MIDIWEAIQWAVFGLALFLAQRHFAKRRVKQEITDLRARAERGDYGFSGVKPEMLDIPATEAEWEEAEKELMEE